MCRFCDTAPTSEDPEEILLIEVHTQYVLVPGFGWILVEDLRSVIYHVPPF